ncbi:carboxynorspermidine decarboxylase [Glaciecola petra]|uniref:Carboxynorspermidine/carboxyspermidine decarboxylase n=1 Tax=Glaciecola petra TaxID=3075602 RepID=A0ABU2ZM05_9ALTE|nr:carboxynorspermidine decarboxylase [Aestuariibacter sp. P117]MDT0593435.1 carboxynorspermidine decarboxylase [Aestuariibacter sp. P117]
MNDIDIPSPCYVCDESKLLRNLRIMQNVQEQAGIDIILALKGFSMWSTFDMVRQFLKGATASSVWEAKLAKEEMRGEVHAYSPAYKDADIKQLVSLCEHISFNSISQFRRFETQVKAAKVSIGLRVNPENQEAQTPIYDPCAPGSRLGILASQLSNQDLTGVEGFHIHNLCECDSYAAERTLLAIEDKFAQYLPGLKWLNLGGGHLMTSANYDLSHLISVLNTFKAKYPHLRIIMEPGSAVAWQAGYLVSEVVDIVKNEDEIAILDISATAHMPDVLEMPYRPEVRYAAMPNVLPFNYKLGGNSCLAGDVIDKYSFEKPLKIGQQLIFEDMLHYTMVKTTFFNGVEHPAIGILRENGQFELVKKYSYSDFRNRLS